jgi:hypothetical protein
MHRSRSMTGFEVRIFLSSSFISRTQDNNCMTVSFVS